MFFPQIPWIVSVWSKSVSLRSGFETRVRNLRGSMQLFVIYIVQIGCRLIFYLVHRNKLALSFWLERRAGGHVVALEKDLLQIWHVVRVGRGYFVFFFHFLSDRLLKRRRKPATEILAFVDHRILGLVWAGARQLGRIKLYFVAARARREVAVAFFWVGRFFQIFIQIRNALIRSRTGRVRLLN